MKEKIRRDLWEVFTFLFTVLPVFIVAIAAVSVIAVVMVDFVFRVLNK